MKRIEINRDLAGESRQLGLSNREVFLKNGVTAVNLMSSPGSGKTTLLERTAAHFSGGLGLSVLVGDISTNRDAERIRLADSGIQAEQIVTEDYGSACHLHATMIKEALPRIDLDRAGLLFIENVGNLVCPSGAYLGEDKRAVLLSVPEGDDKVKKYPVMFREADVLLITKTDLLSVCAFDADRAEKEARELKGDIEVIRLSAKTGEGIPALLQRVQEVLERAMVPMSVEIPYRRGDLVDLFHKRGLVEAETHGGHGTNIEGKLPAPLVPQFRQYQRA